MILVIIGLMYTFERLVKEMDKIAANIDEEIIMQIGNTLYEPKNAKYYRFISEKEINRLYDDTRIIICHAGVGTILNSISRNKLVIVVPRRKKYGEHVDDHQIEITRELEKDGIIKAVYNIDELENILKNMLKDTNKTTKASKTENLLMIKLKEYINGLNC